MDDVLLKNHSEKEAEERDDETSTLHVSSEK